MAKKNSRKKWSTHGYPARLEPQAQVREAYQATNYKAYQDCSQGEFWLRTREAPWFDETK